MPSLRHQGSASSLGSFHSALNSISETEEHSFNERFENPQERLEQRNEDHINPESKAALQLNAPGYNSRGRTSNFTGEFQDSCF